ncbi:MAG: RDD family protein [Rufibacter sp.]
METTTDSTFNFMGGEFAPDTAEPVYAGFWIRFAAVIIDGFVLAIPSWILTVIFAGSLAFTEMDNLEANPFAIIAAMSTFFMAATAMSILYKAIMESSSWQATLGKKALDLKVTDEYGQRISFVRSLGRSIATYISGMIMYIGYIMAAFTSRKQALHDKIAGTLVVKKNG